MPRRRRTAPSCQAGLLACALHRQGSRWPHEHRRHDPGLARRLLL